LSALGLSLFTYAKLELSTRLALVMLAPNVISLLPKRSGLLVLPIPAWFSAVIPFVKLSMLRATFDFLLAWWVLPSLRALAGMLLHLHPLAFTATTAVRQVTTPHSATAKLTTKSISSAAAEAPSTALR
jgi:hypothetical protein